MKYIHVWQCIHLSHLYLSDLSLFLANEIVDLINLAKFIHWSCVLLYNEDTTL